MNRLAVLLLSVFISFAAIPSVFARGTNTKPSADFVEKLTSQLEVIAQEDASSAQIMALVAATLHETHPEIVQTFDTETKQERRGLARKFWDFLRYKMDHRPRTLSQVGEAFRNVGRAIKHAITELPSEVGARMYGGVFEFGSLYVAIVGTTFPPWFLGSETVEHLVLGAPLGMACTHLQLGYFVVIGKLLAPASMVCNYAFRDLSKEPWYKRLARIPKNLILAHQDYVRMRWLKRQYSVIEVEQVGTDPLQRQTLLKSRWYENQSGVPKAILKDPVLWPALLNLPAISGANHFDQSFIRFSVMKLILDRMSETTKLLREEKLLNFWQYTQFLRLQSYMARDLRRLLVFERKSEGSQFIIPNMLEKVKNFLALQRTAEEGKITNDLLKSEMARFSSCEVLVAGN